LCNVSGVFDFDAAPLVAVRDCVLRLGTMMHVFAFADNGSSHFSAVDGSSSLEFKQADSLCKNTKDEIGVEQKNL
jgi:hypothetical protein